MTEICDCGHHTHDPAGIGTPTEHDYGGATAVATVNSPWGAIFRLCQACLNAGHIRARSFVNRVVEPEGSRNDLRRLR